MSQDEISQTRPPLDAGEPASAGIRANEPESPSADACSQIDDGVEPRLTRNHRKLLLLAVLAAVAGILAWQFGSFLKLEYLATQETKLRALQQDSPLLVFGAAFLIYVLVTGMSLPGAAPLTLLYGWYFGFAPTLVLVSFASTGGATISFLTSRYFLRDSIEQKFGDRLQQFNEHLEREGAFYLFTLRLIPVIPFFVINLVMGLPPISTRTYWWVSQLGMLPGTAVYVYAGSSVPNLSQLAEQGAAAVLSPQQLSQLFIAFALLGALSSFNDTPRS